MAGGCFWLRADGTRTQELLSIIESVGAHGSAISKAITSKGGRRGIELDVNCAIEEEQLVESQLVFLPEQVDCIFNP